VQYDITAATTTPGAMAASLISLQGVPDIAPILQQKTGILPYQRATGRKKSRCPGDFHRTWVFLWKKSRYNLS
jgi:hypothetical protein